MEWSEEFKQAFDNFKAEARTALEQLITIAEQLKLETVAADLNTAKLRLSEDAFVLMLMGIFNSGKSTLLNALLGQPLVEIPDLTDGKAPMPMGKLPTTAVLTSIKYGTDPSIYAWNFEGKCMDDWNFHRYLKQAKVKEDEQATREFFRNIREFEVHYPCLLTASGVECMDSPGTDDLPERTAITLEAIPRCDAAIALFRSDFLANESSRKFFHDAQKTGLRMFWVVNLMHDDRPDSDDYPIAFLWSRIIELTLGGPKYTGQSLEDFARYDVYFVNAQKALKGRFLNDQSLLQESGILLLEERLRDFLLRERMIVHIQRHVELGVNRADTLRQTIHTFKGVISADQQELIKARKELEPKLAELRRRAKSLDQLIDRYQEEILNAVGIEFDAYATSLAAKLPEVYGKKEMKTLKGLNPVWLPLPNHQEKVMNEGKQLLQESLSELGEEFSTRLQSRITDILERMHEEIKDRITELSQEYSQLRAKIPGTSLQISGEMVSTLDRVLSALAGLLLLDPAGIMFGSSLGFRGLLSTLLVQVAVWATAFATGSLAVLYIAWPAVILAAIFAAILGLEDRVKKFFVREFLKTYNLSRSDINNRSNLKSEQQEELYQATREYQRHRLLENIELELNTKTFQEVRKQVNAYIDEEEGIIRQSIEEGLKDEAEKAQRLHEFSQLEATIASAKSDLKDVLVRVKQLG
ncbi:hypothetical protein HJG54_29850 [Leptolyngbya sp. NK1-12]|uniref:Dynamin N-terminal domain-containing protein n=1 Tax=Leptolyngbya sp. NK1-12 TaxID=2547451 RepID=A0AA96WYM0_9CYAN|nr:hypothetical protein HJG54_29850 [Leptolyngbya sp. NK1-12]